jgi:acyl-CoA thioesterase-1
MVRFSEPLVTTFETFANRIMIWCNCNDRVAVRIIINLVSGQLMNMPSIHDKFKCFSGAVQKGVRLSLLLGSILILGLAVGCRKSNTAESAESATANASASPSPTASPEEEDPPRIVAFGDSLTAGFGLDPSQSYPALLQKRLDDAGYTFKVINSGLSGDTSAGGVRRLEWALKGDVKFLILELGANDALRGQSVAEMKSNLANIIKRAQERKVTVILAGMEAPPNYGGDYTRSFREAFRDLAAEYDIPLIPFFLEGVGGVAHLNQGDGIHPNVQGTQIVMENVWRVLEPLLAQPAAGETPSAESKSDR